MPLDQPLTSIQRQLRDLLADDLAAALSRLKELLPEFAEKQAIVLSLLGRHNDSNRKRIRNLISTEEHQREIDRIRADFLDLVQSLAEEDFNDVPPPKQVSGGKNGRRTGSVLYRLPRRMLLQKPVRCVVRVAIDEDAIVENITLDEAVTLRHNLLVSNAMEARLLDLEGGCFTITSPNATRQVINETGYTEWLFFVTPLRAGTHELIVKVSMLENVPDMGWVPREVSLEELVEIVTENPSHEDELPLKPAGIAFDLLNTGTEIYSQIPPHLDSATLNPPFERQFFHLANELTNAMFGVFMLLYVLIFPSPASSFPGIIPSDPPPPPTRSVGIVILSPHDSIALNLRVSEKKVMIYPFRPGVWTTHFMLPNTPGLYSINYKGDKKQGYWLDSLTHAINYFFVTDSGVTHLGCGIFATVDTVVQHIERWQLVWVQNMTDSMTFNAYPLNDRLFYIFLDHWCQEVYPPGVPRAFAFKNGPVWLTAKDLSQQLREPPDTISFVRPSERKYYDPPNVTLYFSRTMTLTGVGVNGHHAHYFNSFSRPDDPNKNTGVNFVASAVNVEGLGDQVDSYTFQIESSDCICDSLMRPYQPVIKDTIYCRLKHRDKHNVPAIKVKPNKPVVAPVELTLPQKLRLDKYLADLEITIDGKHYSGNGKITIKNGKIYLPLEPTIKKRRICLQFLSSISTGEAFLLGCYEGPILSGMRLELVAGEIVRK